ncbi:hypothetical protein, partial [Mesorhizobium sp.]|uniref:hypothetical protein n=1 Tax=Mesorhizobium sp. TaxID=1871066 RepID=UPI0025CE31E7
GQDSASQGASRHAWRTRKKAGLDSPAKRRIEPSEGAVQKLGRKQLNVFLLTWFSVIFDQDICKD